MTQYRLEVRAQFQKVKDKHYLVERAGGSKTQSFLKNKNLFFQAQEKLLQKG